MVDNMKAKVDHKFPAPPKSFSRVQPYYSMNDSEHSSPSKQVTSVGSMLS